MIGHLPMMPDPSAAHRLPEPRTRRLSDRQHRTLRREIGRYGASSRPDRPIAKLNTLRLVEALPGHSWTPA
jgi:hypothetical protein